jgi:hypothetical protein
MYHGRYSFTIKTGTDSKPAHFIWDGMVEYYKLAGECLYFTGNPPNTPPGIWQYNINAKAAHCLAAGLKDNFKSAKMVTPLSGTGKNAAGREMSYHLWRRHRFHRGESIRLFGERIRCFWHFRRRC